MASHDGKKYLRQLLSKATEYINDSSEPEFDRVKFFYRCKSDDYFREVKRNDNVMKPIKKDFNGDPKSPINGKLKGVFLGVDLYLGDLPTASPFGNTRVSFPIRAIFTEDTNLYFTDFYCTVSNYHYVTLVLAKEFSSADDFCDSKLLKLDPSNNPFLLKKGSRFKVVQAVYLHVEVFYVGKIDLDSLTKRFGAKRVFLESIGTLGKGSSTWGGLLKNPNCKKCNPTRQTPTRNPTRQTPTCNPTRQTLTTTLLKEDYLSTSRSPTKPVTIRKNITAMKEPSHSEAESPKPRIPSGSPWWRLLTKWQTWLAVASFCVAFYLTNMK